MATTREIQEYLEHLTEKIGNAGLNWERLAGLDESRITAHRNKFGCLGVSERIPATQEKTSEQRANDIAEKLNSMFQNISDDDGDVFEAKSSDNVNFRVFASDKFVIQAAESFQFEKLYASITRNLDYAAQHLNKPQASYDIAQATKALIAFSEYLREYPDSTWPKKNSKMIETILTNSLIRNAVKQYPSLEEPYKYLLNVASSNNPNFRLSSEVSTSQTSPSPIVHQFRTNVNNGTSSTTTIPKNESSLSENKNISPEELLAELVKTSRLNGGKLDTSTITKCTDNPSFTAKVINAIGEGLTKEKDNPKMYSSAMSICEMFQELYLQGGKLAENINGAMDSVGQKQLKKSPNDLHDVLLTTQIYKSSKQDDHKKPTMK